MDNRRLAPERAARRGEAQGWAVQSLTLPLSFLRNQKTPARAFYYGWRRRGLDENPFGSTQICLEQIWTTEGWPRSAQRGGARPIDGPSTIYLERIYQRQILFWQCSRRPLPASAAGYAATAARADSVCACAARSSGARSRFSSACSTSIELTTPLISRKRSCARTSERIHALGKQGGLFFALDQCREGVFHILGGVQRGKPIRSQQRRRSDRAVRGQRLRHPAHGAGSAAAHARATQRQNRQHQFGARLSASAVHGTVCGVQA